MDYSVLRSALDARFNRILKDLPKAFSSAQFISKVKDYFPDEYAVILRNSETASSAYRSLHVWISRWYLNGKASAGLIRKTKDKKIIKSVNGNDSKNTVWVK